MRMKWQVDRGAGVSIDRHLRRTTAVMSCCVVSLGAMSYHIHY